MVTPFAKSMNTHITFSPVFKVKDKHSIEKNHVSYAPTQKSHYKNLCQEAGHCFLCGLMWWPAAYPWNGWAWVIGNCDVGDSSGAALQPQCAKLVLFSYHSS